MVQASRTIFFWKFEEALDQSIALLDLKKKEDHGKTASSDDCRGTSLCLVIARSVGSYHTEFLSAEGMDWGCDAATS